MTQNLEAKEIERLENTSFASAFASTAEAADVAVAQETGNVCALITGMFTHHSAVDCVLEIVGDVVEIDITLTYTFICPTVHTQAGASAGDAGLVEALRGDA